MYNRDVLCCASISCIVISTVMLFPFVFVVAERQTDKTVWPQNTNDTSISNIQ